MMSEIYYCNSVFYICNGLGVINAKIRKTSIKGICVTKLEYMFVASEN